MNIKFLYANGDSCVHGMGLDDSVDTFVFSDIKRNSCWTGLLAHSLGIDLRSYINHSVPGASNDKIIRTTTEFILNLEDDFEFENMLVIIGFTEMTRKELYYVQEKTYINFLKHRRPVNSGLFRSSPVQSMHDLLYLYFSDPYEAEKDFLLKLNSFRCLLEAKRINYLFTFSVSPHRDPASVGYKLSDDNFITDLDHLREKTFNDKVVSENFMSFVRKNNLDITACHHPGHAAHKEWANAILLRIKEKYE